MTTFDPFTHRDAIRADPAEFVPMKSILAIAMTLHEIRHAGTMADLERMYLAAKVANKGDADTLQRLARGKDARKKGLMA